MAELYKLEERGPYTPLAVANWFIHRAIRDACPITPVQAQKLLYVAHGWCLALNNGRPLINSPFEAWKFGPVAPSMYRDLKKFEDRPIHHLGHIDEVDDPHGQPYNVVPLVENEEDESLLDAIWQGYGRLTGSELIKLTHAPGGSWDLITEGGRKIGRNKKIPNDLILNEFRERSEASR